MATSIRTLFSESNRKPQLLAHQWGKWCYPVQQEALSTTEEGLVGQRLGGSPRASILFVSFCPSCLSAPLNIQLAALGATKWLHWPGHDFHTCQCPVEADKYFLLSISFVRRDLFSQLILSYVTCTFQHSTCKGNGNWFHEAVAVEKDRDPGSRCCSLRKKGRGG